jgi:NhaA family Na+:H+ antiporter
MAGKSKLDLNWIDFVAVAALAGVGFTVSLLMANLAFASNAEILAEATLAVILGSLMSMTIGAVLSQLRGRHYRRVKKGSVELAKRSDS